MAKKIILIVVGAILLLCGLGAIVPGGLLAGVSGTDNTIDSGYHPIGTETSALVSETARVSDASGVRTAGIGAATITVAARSDQPIFLGIARTSDVEIYLNGVAFDELTDFNLSPYRVDTRRHDGSLIAAPPTDEGFWTDSATGTAPTLDWNVAGGDYRLVMMNLDGSPGVGAEAQFGLTVDGLFGIGLGILIAGVIAALVGLALLIWGLVTRAGPQPALAGGSPSASAPPGPPHSQPAESGPPPPGMQYGEASPPHASAPPPES